MGSGTRISLIASLLIGLSVTVSADVITDWNDKVVAAGVQARQAPFVHTRSVAIVHVAMFDAINSIDRRYRPYRVQGPALLAHRVRRLRPPLPTSPWSVCIRTKRRSSIASIKRRWQRFQMGSRNRKGSSLANR